MNLEGVVWSLSSLAENSEDEVPMSNLGRNVINFLNQLETSNLKKDLEEISRRVAEGKRAAKEARVVARWECVAAVLDGYYFQYCLNPSRGDLLLNREGTVIGSLGCLINSDGKIVGWVDRSTVSKAKGVPEKSVGQNFVSSLLKGISPQELSNAEAELIKHSPQGAGNPAAPGGWVFPVVVGYTIWTMTKNRLVEEYDYRSGYEDVHENRRHVNQMRFSRGLPPI